jgi:hypothetical protein
MARYFRLVGAGVDAKTFKRCLAIGCCVTFDGVLVHTGPQSADGRRRGVCLGAGEVRLDRSARAEDDGVNRAGRGGSLSSRSSPRHPPRMRRAPRYRLSRLS